MPQLYSVLTLCSFHIYILADQLYLWISFISMPPLLHFDVDVSEHIRSINLSFKPEIKNNVHNFTFQNSLNGNSYTSVSGCVQVVEA